VEFKQVMTELSTANRSDELLTGPFSWGKVAPTMCECGDIYGTEKYGLKCV